MSAGIPNPAGPGRFCDECKRAIAESDRYFAFDDGRELCETCNRDLFGDAKAPVSWLRLELTLASARGKTTAKIEAAPATLRALCQDKCFGATLFDALWRTAFGKGLVGAKD